MFGVIRLTFDDDAESIRGEEDFFSVARTMPLVAANKGQSLNYPTMNIDITLDS